MPSSSLAHPTPRVRREILLRQIEQQREDLALQLLEVQQSFSFVQQGYEVVEQLKQHRLALFGVAALVMIVRPKRIFSGLKMSLRAWAIWKTIRH